MTAATTSPTVRSLFLTTLFVTLLGISTHQAEAQIVAVTSNGDRVLLFPNGTWRYDDERGPLDPFPQDPWERSPYTEVLVRSTAQGENAVITLQDGLVLTIEKGQIVDYSYYRPYSWGNRDERSWDDYHKRYDRIGQHRIEYDFITGKIERIGPHKIKYDFFTEGVSQIDNLRIEYDRNTLKMNSIGSTRLIYDVWHRRLEEVKAGKDQGIRIILY